MYEWCGCSHAGFVVYALMAELAGICQARAGWAFVYLRIVTHGRHAPPCTRHAHIRRVHVLSCGWGGKGGGGASKATLWTSKHAHPQYTHATLQAVQRHRGIIVECVKDPDVSLRRRALDLVYSLVNKDNICNLTKVRVPA